jgi:hypothetical protein
MAWPYSPLTTYVASSTPSIRAFDLNAMQAQINVLSDTVDNQLYQVTPDFMPKAWGTMLTNGSKAWLASYGLSATISDSGAGLRCTLDVAMTLNRFCVIAHIHDAANPYIAVAKTSISTTEFDVFVFNMAGGTITISGGGASGAAISVIVFGPH